MDRMKLVMDVFIVFVVFIIICYYARKHGKTM